MFAHLKLAPISLHSAKVHPLQLGQVLVDVVPNCDERFGREQSVLEWMILKLFV